MRMGFISPHLMPHVTFHHRPLILALLGVLVGCAAPSARLDLQSKLPKLMADRLAWVDEVACVKQARSLPVDDPKREAELLNAMEKRAVAMDIPASAIRAFFTGQIDAAKHLQREWINTHHTPLSSTTDPLPDLAKTIRPALDEISTRMIEALKKARASNTPEAVIVQAREHLTSAGYSESVVTLAIAGLEAGLGVGR